MIENLEKLFRACGVPSRSTKKKISKHWKVVTFVYPVDENTDNEEIVKMFCKYHVTCGHTTNKCTTIKVLIIASSEIELVKSVQEREKLYQIGGQYYGGKKSEEGI